MSNVQTKDALSVLALDHDRYCHEAKEILNRSNQSGVITIGLELEIFLRDSNDQLSSLDQSQEFLKKLSELPHWKIFQRSDQSQYITRVSFELENGKYHSVKYEHPPHLIELALSYFDNILELKEHLHSSLSDMHQAAHQAGLKLDINANAEPTKLDWPLINKIEGRFENLSNSRKKLFNHFNQEIVDESKINFTTYTAATQYHIGGIRWWNQNPEFMNRIHQNEFLISANAFKTKKEFDTRWDSYRYVFRQMKLLGFPQIDNWTFENWIQTMIQDNPFESNLIKMRDLEIIKPKWIGTIEFRSDPATKDLDLIIAQAALRLGSYLNAMKSGYKSPLNSMPINALSGLWHQGDHIGNTFKHESELVKEHAWNALRERNKYEEGLL